MDLSLFFLGTGGAVPSARRGLPAVLLSRGGDRVLFDCGEGTQRQLVRSVGLIDVDRVFLTHFHADHWLGLPGMMKTFALRERERPLTVYGPPGLKRLMGAMEVVYGRRLPYEVQVRELERWNEVELDGYMVAAVPVVHGELPAFGYSIIEDAVTAVTRDEPGGWVFNTSPRDRAEVVTVPAALATDQEAQVLADGYFVLQCSQ